MRITKRPRAVAPVGMMLVRRASLAAAGALVLAACTRVPGGLPVASFDMDDLQVPPMFQRLASGLSRPYVMELPPRSVDARFTVHLGRTTEREVLETLVARDPTFQYRMDEGADLLWPKGDEAARSPWSKPLPATKWEGGAGEAARKLMAAAGLADGQLRADMVAARRPVSLDLPEGTTLRDAMAVIAAQAKLAFLLDRNAANMTRIESGVGGAVAPESGQGPMGSTDLSPSPDPPRP